MKDMLVETNKIIFIDDNWIKDRAANPERYGEELEKQNKLFSEDYSVFRILSPDYTKENLDFHISDLNVAQKDFIRTVNTTKSEDDFEEIFASALGFDNREFLSFQYPIKYNGENIIYIDYVLKTSIGLIAIEINGETFHNPCFTGIKPYLKQIQRQNYIVSKGFKVFRWTSRQLVENKDEIIQFLKDYFSNLTFFRHEELIERNKVYFVDNWEHQEQALKALEEARNNGDKAALLTQATGTGKTVIAIKDAQRINGNTLYVAHTKELIEQAKTRFQEHWGSAWNEGKITCRTIQGMFNNLRNIEPDYYKYVIIDEAHHGAARTYRFLIEYLDPDFLLGLTATPERSDRQDLEEIFGKIAHSLDIQRAIKKGKLAPIRAIRINTNIDFSNIKVNRYDYTKKDLEKRLIVDQRDDIILETYIKYIKGTGKKTVIFCISVDHAKRLAKLFNKNGIKSSEIHGSMNIKEREDILNRYHNGDVDVLMACSLLSEGWDSPKTSVLFMARPTMSKVLYMQQLGRGVRKSEGKDYLLVVDFVDNFMTTDPSWSIHAVFNLNQYRIGDFVCCPDSLMKLKIQPDFIQNLDINLWVSSLQEIDPFTFEQKVEDMISMPELSRELWVSEETVRIHIKNRKIIPDKEFSFGNRNLYFFYKSSIELIRKQLDLKPRDITTIKNDFFEFIGNKDYTYSYKMIFILSLLKHVNSKGIANIDAFLNSYISFYLYLMDKRLTVESEKSPYNNKEFLIDKKSVKRHVLKYPYEKFERKRFINYCKDLSEVSFNNHLWKSLNINDIENIKRQMKEDLKDYYKTRLNYDLEAKIFQFIDEG